MESNTLVEQQLHEQDPALAAILKRSSEDTLDVVDHLKREADRYHAIDANRSLELAEQILTIGRLRADQRIEALGLMAHADALRLLGRNQEAWQAFDDAGTLYRQTADDVGWARTRLGRLGVGHSLGRLDQAMQDVERARAIFARHDERLRLVTLDLNLAAVHHLSGHYEQALVLYQRARQGSDTLGEQGDFYRGPITTNLGLLYTMLGDLPNALRCQEEALALFERRSEASDAAVARLNLADILLHQGQYRRALDLLYRVRAFYSEMGLPRHAAEAGRSMVEALLQLNRFEEARVAAIEALKAFRDFDATYGQAQTLLLLGTAEGELGQFDLAEPHLAEAQSIFRATDAAAWAALAELGRARVAFAQQNFGRAEPLAVNAQEQLAAAGLEVQAAEALLVLGRVLVARGEDSRARPLIRKALATARRCGVPTLRYSLLLLQGRLHEAHDRLHIARRSYEAAVLVVERIERQLTITLRSDFLQSKREGSARLFELYLRKGDAEQAWRTLERAKSLAFTGYLAGQGMLRWRVDDVHGQRLLDQLTALREEHHWLFRRAHALPETNSSLSASPDPVPVEIRLKECERRIRTLSERLHLLNGDRAAESGYTAPRLEDVCAHLADGVLMIEYGSDGERLWAFMIDRHGIRVQPLTVRIPQVAHTIMLLHTNLNSALRMGTGGRTRGLSATCTLLLQRLDGWLLRELRVPWDRYQQLIVVPYGALHYLPFHLLHDGTAYRLAHHEVIALPAATLVTRPRHAARGPIRALALAYSDGGRLPSTVEEAQMVVSRFGGRCLVEDAARRAALVEASHYHILHLAAHGEHRPDAPEFSFIELSDGYVQADDLFQLQLDCSLVTLSACETGRAVVAPGDDLIGLGRGLLYAGARSLVLSQWRADDCVTLEIMRRFYQEIDAGRSKAAALRISQHEFASDHPDIHPALWGAFQLIGDGGPL